ncbi:MAG: SDR family oxidoreductase [Halieaceae bacterium]|jgi:NAD(P)-dependent dehydrogenase (short-subunit alcohol dehydrogenase family)|nr:SDR family oxidoreductase [Halieaceae bacterium]
MPSTDVNTALSMHGKVALVTGASSGFGAHFARLLADAGASVALGARRMERLESLVREIENSGGKAMAVDLDVTRSDSVENALDRIEDKLGPITVLINNAGVADSRHCLNVDEPSWDFVLDTNLKGAWRMAHAVASRCVQRGLSGSVVNIASILSLRVKFGESSYATSKAALLQLTKSMALELGRKGIRVNALCPGYFKTELNDAYFESEKGQTYIATTPAQRLGELHELNMPLLMLASDAGSFINGAAIPVDGGHLNSSL